MVCISQIGQLTAMSLVHGSGAIIIFCPAVYNYMCGMSPSDIIVSSDEVPDKIIKLVMVINSVRKVYCTSKNSALLIIQHPLPING